MLKVTEGEGKFKEDICLKTTIENRITTTPKNTMILLNVLYNALTETGTLWETVHTMKINRHSNEPQLCNEQVHIPIWIKQASQQFQS